MEAHPVAESTKRSRGNENNSREKRRDIQTGLTGYEIKLLLLIEITTVFVVVNIIITVVMKHSNNKKCYGTDKPRFKHSGDKNKHVSGVKIHHYLLVIAVWERQEGANTALKIRRTTNVKSSVPSLSRMNAENLRDVSQRGLELPAQVLHVLPLSLAHRPSSHVDVLHPQLLLVKQPLHDEQRSCKGKTDV